jgi:hypothetical protein
MFLPSSQLASQSTSVICYNLATAHRTAPSPNPTTPTTVKFPR